MRDITHEIEIRVDIANVLEELEILIARINEIANSPDMKALIALYPNLYREAAEATINDLVNKQLKVEIGRKL